MENQYSEIKLEIEEFLAEIENNKDFCSQHQVCEMKVKSLEDKVDELKESTENQVNDLKEITSKNVRGLVKKIRAYIEFLNDNIKYKTKFYELGDGISVTERRLK